MEIKNSIPLLDEILEEYKNVIAQDYKAYRNHCTRMLQYCFALKPDCDEDEQAKLTIAAAFHDIGIWIENTVDYIPPSLPSAKTYLEDTGRSEWYKEINLMITEHHKLTPYKEDGSALIEVFRKGDLVDFSMGTVRFGLPKNMIKGMNKALPNEGFHKMLLGRATKWFIKHPLNPAPMMKW